MARFPVERCQWSLDKINIYMSKMTMTLTGDKFVSRLKTCEPWVTFRTAAGLELDPEATGWCEDNVRRRIVIVITSEHTADVSPILTVPGLKNKEPHTSKFSK